MFLVSCNVDADRAVNATAPFQRRLHVPGTLCLRLFDKQHNAVVPLGPEHSYFRHILTAWHSLVLLTVKCPDTILPRDVLCAFRSIATASPLSVCLSVRP